ncbi:hypothetical protein NGA_0317700, partial [Nannochloropsis gaditana CCMP526]|uniref:uncharacterized protein n=1 Tax=Nannochloropsis gaditana (strain CCMP526) TaxID=1093141 RepID=UPI00029F7B99
MPTLNEDNQRRQVSGALVKGERMRHGRPGRTASVDDSFTTAHPRMPEASSTTSSS